MPEDEVREGFEIASSIAHKWYEEFGLEIPLEVFGKGSKDKDLQYLRFVAVAYAISSRIFEIDAFHGSALVPLADLFNHHVLRPDVHFNSLYDVCELCGEPGMCGHMGAETMTNVDQDEEPSDFASDNGNEGLSNSHREPSESDENSSGSDDDLDSDDENPSGSDEDADDSNSSSEDLFVDMVLVTDIKAGDEIFNSYGELSNSLLLARYGFCVPNNPLDIVHLGREILSLAKVSTKYKNRLKWWSRIGHELYRNWLNAMEDTGSDEESEQGDDQQEGINPWLSEIYIEFNGNPSPILKALLNLLSLNYKDWERLHNNFERDISANLKLFRVLDKKANQDHKIIFQQLLVSKKSSQASGVIANVGHICNQDRLTCIKLLLENERNIIERAKKLVLNR